MTSKSSLKRSLSDIHRYKFTIYYCARYTLEPDGQREFSLNVTLVTILPISIFYTSVLLTCNLRGLRR